MVTYEVISNRSLNSKLNHEEFSQQSVRLESRPRMLFLELTRSCNLSCPMCRPQVLAGEHLAMSDETLHRVKEELFPYVEVADLRGWGESTLDRRLFGLIDQLNASGVQTKLFTNLTTHTPAFWREMGRRNTGIAVSLEAATATSYETYRRGARFTHFLQNLEALREEQLKRNGFNEIYLSIVVFDENLMELTRLIQFASHYAVPVVRLNPITLADDHTRYPRIGVAQENLSNLMDSLRTAQKLAQSMGVRLQLAANLSSSDWRYGGYEQCLHPWSYVCVRYDGGISFCDHLDTNDSVLGNIMQSAFMDVWNGDAYQSLRRDHIAHNFGRLHSLGMECDWCYKNRYADCEGLIEPKLQPLDISDFASIDTLQPSPPEY